MSVVFVSHKYPPSIGGMEKQSYELIHGYKKIAHCHELIYDGSENFLFWVLKLRSRLKKIVLNNPDIDIIHLNDGLMATLFYLLVGRPVGIKIFVTFHGLDVTFPFWIYQKVILNKLKQYDGFICVSRATKQACIDRGFDANKLTIISNGVSIHLEKGASNKIISNFDSFYNKYRISPNEDKLLVCIGRPVKRKGFVWFAREVLPILPLEYKLVHIGNSTYKNSFLKRLFPESWFTVLDLLLGTPSDANGLRIMSKEKALNNRLILLGQVSNEMKDQIIKSAYAVVIPNIAVKGDMEGFGLVALEAAILGARVLAADIEGLQDAIIDGKNGILIKSEDVNEWKNTILMLASQTILDNEQIASYTTSKFNWNQMVLEYKKAFNCE